MADKPVKLNGPADIVQSVPHLLGFHPQESLVVIALNEQHRLVLSMRVDLDGGAEAINGGALDDAMAQAGASQLVAVVYTESAGDLPSRDVVDALRGHHPQPLMDALLVRDGRWRSYLCEQECCPPEGTAIAGSAAAEQLAAEQAGVGRGVLPNRDAVAASIAAGPRLVAPTEHPTAVAFALVPSTIGRTDLQDVEVADLAVFCQSGKGRDLLIATAVKNGTEAQLLATLTTAASRLSDVDAAHVCGLLSVAAYLTGDGVLARAASERALAGNPDERMARLMATVVDKAIPPQVLRGMALSL